MNPKITVREISPEIIDVIKFCINPTTGLIIPRTKRELDQFRLDDLLIFIHFMAIYIFPTKELLDFLEEEIQVPKSSVLEVGAGMGYLGRALGVRVTDSYFHAENPEVRQRAEFLGYPQMTPETNGVEKMEALKAVGRYRPLVVIAAACSPPETFGYAIDMPAVLARSRKLILMGQSVHLPHQMMNKPHRTIDPPWLLSRNGWGKEVGNWLWVFRKR